MYAPSGRQPSVTQTLVLQVHDQQAESAKGGEKDGSGHQGGQDEEVGEEAGTDNEGALGGDEAVPNSPSPSRSKGSQVQRSPPAKTKVSTPDHYLHQSQVQRCTQDLQ